ncbi:protein 5NUC-like [Thrips palmi]|uniref:5'-nucleotidase n=1 Tax=Thrips palmi TaxID=161013 RepID=A0A6P8YRS4_THRPL|nr:protein 5NUC-like [Thrips palmi]
MQRSVSAAAAVACLVVLAVAPALAGPAAPTDYPTDAPTDAPATTTPGLDLLLIHTNDMHARFEQTNRFSSRCSDAEAASNSCYGGYARIAAHIKEARGQAKNGGPAVLVLNAGDTFQGSFYYNIFKWRMAAVLTNMLAFDAMSLGNHEFDDGEAGLEPFLRDVRAPHVCANLDASANPQMQQRVRPSVVLDVNGTSVGVVGYVTSDTALLAKPVQVKFLEEIAAVKAEAQRLHEQGVKIIIALGHSGYPKDKEIAAQVPHVDLVVGGHSHSFLYTGPAPDNDEPVGLYPTFVKQPSGREVPVVQAYAFTKYMGRLRIQFDADGEIASRKDVRGLPVLLDHTQPQDPQVLDELEQWKKQLDPATFEPVGRTLVFLDGVCRIKECNLGNLVADSLVYYRATRYSGPGWTDAPIGVQNGGNIRTSVDKVGDGTINLLNVIETCPFENLLVVVYLRGDVLLQMLEHSVAEYDLQYQKGAFLQYSGIRVIYDLTVAPGRRVVSALALCGNCTIPSYSPVDPRQVYGVVTNDFLVAGGDGFKMLKDAPSLSLADVTPYGALAEYIRIHKVVAPAVEGRVGFLDRRKKPMPNAASTALPQSSLLLVFSLMLLLLSTNR